jgi:hypothetical protein
MGSGWGSVEAARRGFGGGEQLGKRDASRQPGQGSRACYAQDLGESSASRVLGRALLVQRKPHVHLGHRSVWRRKLCVVGGISAAGEGSRTCWGGSRARGEIGGGHGDDCKRPHSSLK